MESVQATKQRFGIIGNDATLNRCIEKAIRVAPTDISILVTGESGVGKESIPRIIHSLSHRKHGKYIAVNCGAIPEGTIDSELFGHEKGAFTGATQSRNGYFEVADNGTIFLDEVGELPLTTQVRLLRILENGEFIKVGSSKVQKTNIRIIAATNVGMIEAIKKGKFREDLYYRLSTVEIQLPALRNRKGDIHLLFRKFASDFALKYKMPAIKLTQDAIEYLIHHQWQGNIRQLRNIAEQISVLETQREINTNLLASYLPKPTHNHLPTVVNHNSQIESNELKREREVLYKILFEMKSELNELREVTKSLIKDNNIKSLQTNTRISNSSFDGAFEELKDNIKAYTDINSNINSNNISGEHNSIFNQNLNTQNTEDNKNYSDTLTIDIETENLSNETLSIQDKELELIEKSLQRHNGKRKAAAQELGISERTLYRKIKQYGL